MTNHPNDFASYSPRPRTTTVPAVKNPPAILKPKPSPSTSLRPVGLRQCPNCTFHVHTHYTACPQCGEQLQAKLKKVRCRHCNKHAPSTLVICPSCGRELKAAASRWLTWGAPVLLVALFIAILIARWDGGNPIVWAQEVAQKGVSFFLDLGERMDPELDISTTPVVPDGADEPNGQNIDPEGSSSTTSTLTVNTLGASGQAIEVNEEPSNLSSFATVSQEVDEPSGGDGGEESSLNETVALSPTDTPEPTATEVPIPTATATLVVKSEKELQVSPSKEPTSKPTKSGKDSIFGQEGTETASSLDEEIPADESELDESELDELEEDISEEDQSNVDSLETGEINASALDEGDALDSGSEFSRPTSTPMPAPTAKPKSISYEMQEGDTLVKLAIRFGVSTKAIMAANNLSETDAYKLQLGQTLIIPLDENFVATAEPSTQEESSYTVRRGDTIVGIANRFDLTIEQLLRANGLSEDEGQLIQPEQLLIIPDPNQISTAPSPTPNVAPSASGPADVEYRLDQPILKGPDDGTPLRCHAKDSLTWYPIPYIAPDDRYMLHLGYLDGYNEDGTESITWVIEHKSSPPNGTSWTLEPNLCGISNQQYGRQWRWYVEAVELRGNESIPISPPSEIRGFSWQ